MNYWKVTYLRCGQLVTSITQGNYCLSDFKDYDSILMDNDDLVMVTAFISLSKVTKEV